MNNLLDAGFHKLFRSVVYRLCALYVFIFSLFLIGTRVADSITYSDLPRETLDGIINSGAITISGVAPVFISLFIGREYSDQTIRNKISVGHKRSVIYFSNLIISIVGTLILQLLCLLPIYIAGMTYFTPFTTSLTDLIVLQLLASCVMVAVASVYNMLAMLITNKSVTAIVSLLTAFVLFMGGMLVHMSLIEDEVARGGSIDSDTVYMGSTEELEEASFMSDTQRSIYRFLEVFLPSAQAVTLTGNEIPEAWPGMVGSDLAIVVITSAAGYGSFRRKDLK